MTHLSLLIQELEQRYNSVTFGISFAFATTTLQFLQRRAKRAHVPLTANLNIWLSQPHTTSGVPRNFVRGGEFNKFGWGQREKGIWGW